MVIRRVGRKVGKREGVVFIPFKSAKQRRYLFAKKPKLAKKWASRYGVKVGGGKTKAQKSKKK